MKSIQELIEFSKQNNRICPQPQIWNKLYEKLKNKERSGSGWKPSLPLILGAWGYTSDLEKQKRFQEHLKWADDHNQLQEIIDFVESLTESQ